MPITSKSTSGSNRYGFPLIGRTEEVLQEKLDVSTLYNTGLVDSDGYLIPGAILRLDAKTLKPVSAGSQVARGITIEAVKVADSNSETDLNNADDLAVAIAVKATIDRAVVEYNYDRSLTANEIEAVGANDGLVITDPET